MSSHSLIQRRWLAIGAAVAFTATLAACDSSSTSTPRTGSAPGVAANPGPNTQSGGTGPATPANPTGTPLSTSGGSAPAHSPPSPPSNPPDRTMGASSSKPLAETGAPESRAPAGSGSASGGAGTSGMSGTGAAAGSGGSADERPSR